jgi:hypothetical protein
MSMRTTHNGWCIEKILRFWGNKTIQIPAEQREQAWKKGKKGDEKRSDFIDSVFNNFPIPSCILFLKVVEGQPDKYNLFDGQNRFRTLFAFSKNEFTYKGKRFEDLTDEDRHVFLGREIQVTEITNGDTVMHLMPTVFTRLNAGVPLKQHDFCHANKSKPLIAEAIRLVVGNQELAHALGGFNMDHRPMLANWVGLTLALSKNNAGLMTTSWTRVAPHIEDDVDVQSVTDGVAAYTNLLERANLSRPVESKVAAKYAKAGFLAAYWLSEWIRAADPDAKEMVQDKWYSIICNLRSRNSETRDAMLDALQTGGAQNLNDTKVEAVLERVAKYVKSDLFEVPDDLKPVDPCTEFHKWAKHELTEAKFVHKAVANQLSEMLDVVEPRLIAMDNSQEEEALNIQAVEDAKGRANSLSAASAVPAIDYDAVD